jgi:polyhydroxyalkanoate synthesis regulator phasin
MALTDEDKQWIVNQLGQKVERVEATLLAEFQKWASPVELRQRTHAAVIRVELETLSERVKKLEDER